MKQSFQYYELQNGDMISHVSSPLELILAVVLRMGQTSSFSQITHKSLKSILEIKANTLLPPPQPCQSPPPLSL